LDASREKQVAVMVLNLELREDGLPVGSPGIGQLCRRPRDFSFGGHSVFSVNFFPGRGCQKKRGAGPWLGLE
jgi:hypothetical protein